MCNLIKESMKLNKYFMLGLAGLAFAACSNEDEVTNTLSNGNRAVSVKIVKPTTKALTSGTTVEIPGNITVTLSNSGSYNESITINTDNLVGTLTFWNVPSVEGLKLTASINGGTSTYANVDIATLWQVAPEDAPAYGETSTFTLSGGTGSPDMGNDGTTEEGANSGDENKEYDLYTATVTMAIPMARLEIGDITFKAPDAPAQSIYATLIYTGCYLDKYATNGGAYSNGAFADATTVGNFWFEANAGQAGQTESSLKYAAAASHDFLTTPIDYTNDADAGAFNFYAATTDPHFKLYFKTGTTAGQTVVGFPRYAMITSYKNTQGTTISLENGHIYQITDVELTDDNFIPDEDGNTMYGVTVTVTEAVWSVQSVTGEWVTQ